MQLYTYYEYVKWVQINPAILIIIVKYKKQFVKNF